MPPPVSQNLWMNRWAILVKYLTCSCSVFDKFLCPPLLHSNPFLPILYANLWGIYHKIPDAGPRLPACRAYASEGYWMKWLILCLCLSGIRHLSFRTALLPTMRDLLHQLVGLRLIFARSWIDKRIEYWLIINHQSSLLNGGLDINFKIWAYENT